ncbi:MAG: Cof-type HAD-IIB family hydrolase [Terriglobales bacterium]
MKPAIRLLAVDIDGTLLDPGFQIPPANQEALQRAHQAGVEVVLVTGRRHTFALPIAQQLGFDLWLISSNGALTKSTGGELFHRDLLPATTACKVCGHMRAFRGNTVITFDVEARGALVLETDEELRQTLGRWLGKNSDFVQYVVPIEDSLSTDPVQLMFCGPIARMKQALAELAAGGFDSEITVLRTEYAHRDLSIVDVLNRGCSKGHALERWARHRGVARAEIMAIGDNYNDVEMLEFAGRPVIMGNAAEELKQNGWAVTLSNAEGGVAVAVDEVLGR